MEAFDPARHIEGASVILGSEWPSFHDAIVYSFNFWRGDIRSEDDVWIGPTIEASIELIELAPPFAPRPPCVVDLKFHDCDHILMQGFDHNNSIYDLLFSFEHRGFYTDGVTPLPPYINVVFDFGSGSEPMLAFKCFRVELVAKRDAPAPPCH